MLFYPIYFHLPQWHDFLIYVMIIPSIILFIVGFIGIVESPVYVLFIKKDVPMFHKVINKLASINDVSEESREEILREGDQIMEAEKDIKQPIS